MGPRPQEWKEADDDEAVMRWSILMAGIAALQHVPFWLRTLVYSLVPADANKWEVANGETHRERSFR